MVIGGYNPSEIKKMFYEIKEMQGKHQIQLTMVS